VNSHSIAPILKRSLVPVTVAVVSILAPAAVFSQEAAHGLAIVNAAGLTPANVTVGQYLQTTATVALKRPVPSGGVQLTLKSNDPSKLRLAITNDAKGSESIAMNLQPGMAVSPEFYVQALAKSGTATYTATAPGFGSSEGTVTMSPSGFVIAARSRIGATSFVSTPGGRSTAITVHAARLDSSLNFAAPQELAGGMPVKVEVTNSNKSVGAINPSSVTIAGGDAVAATEFEPAGAGTATLALNTPANFSTPATLASLTVNIKMPGMSVTDQAMLGKNLQMGGSISLGQMAPAGGVVVTLTSSDPNMIIAHSATEVGSKSITINIPAGGSSATYHLQGLAEKGTVTYTAEAPGYTSRSGTIYLTPSAIVVTGMEFPETGGPADPAFVVSISKDTYTTLMVCSAHLDPKTMRAADLTVQPLRAGYSVTAKLVSDHPEVGTVPATVKLESGKEITPIQLKLLSPGATVVSVNTPDGFTTPKNASWIKAIVSQ
jgi:hypothetical protein